MSGAPFYDALEIRPAAQREAQLFAALPHQVAHAQAHTGAFAQRLAAVNAASINSRAALASLPVTRKAELLQAQQASQAARPSSAEAGQADPFGGFSAVGWEGLVRNRGARRVFQSPGPLYEPEGWARDYWRMARALHAAGLQAGDLVHNSFSYHLTPAGAMMEGAAEALGCTVFPAGVGNTELQLQAIAALRPQAYIGTPGFLKTLIDKMQEQGLPVPFRKALVSGEAFPASLRDWCLERQVQAFQCYATADLGLIAFETSSREGLVVDEGVIVEIVRPGSGDPVPDGEVGEVVVTTLNPDYPLIRFATGDLSAVLPGPCPTGRTNTRIRGWLGRADQSAKVRGMFVHAHHVSALVARCTEALRARLVVTGTLGQDELLLQAEVQGGPDGVPERLAERLAHHWRDLTRLRAEVQLLAPGTLPNDGRVIEDRRSLA